MMDKISNYFKFGEKNTDFKTEILAGLSTFLTMAYIIVVNPGILSNTGMSFAGVLFATILVCSISSILMGLLTNLPFALAPGMGINAFFTFTLVIKMGVTWETALGAVLVSGILFIILSITPARLLIVKAIPESIRYAVAAGIGIFLALIGLKSVGFIVPNEATLVGFGGITPQVILFVFGLFLTGFLIIKKIRGALIIGITSTSILAFIVSKIVVANGGTAFVTYQGIIDLPSLDVFWKFKLLKVFSFSMIMPIFTLLFTDMFDSISTFVGISEVGGFINKETGQPQNVGKALLVDAISTTISGLFGTSSGTTYIESAAGVEEGGRTGLTAIVAGLLFLPFMFFSPILNFVPSVATGPILVLVGLFMIKPLLKIDWSNFEVSIPALLAFILIPLTYSITQGIIWGFLSYTVIKLLLGKFKDISITLWIIDAFAIFSFVIEFIK